MSNTRPRMRALVHSFQSRTRAEREQNASSCGFIIYARREPAPLRSLLPRAHRARRAVCVLGCLDLLAAQHRVCGSITAATTSLQAVLHTSTCTDMESCVDVAQCSGACHTAASASSACLPLALHYTPPPSMLLSQPSLHAATLAATCLPHAATCCHCHTAPHSRSLTPLRAATATPPSSRSSPLKRAVIATRDRSLAAIATWPLPAPHYMLTAVTTRRHTLQRLADRVRVPLDP